MLIDSHCHIQFKAFDEDRDEVLQRCRENNVVLNVVGTQQDTSQLAVELAEKHDNVYATVGLHPIQEHKVKVEEENDSFTSRGEVFDVAYYEHLAAHPKVIAIGETGLDKYHIPKDKTQEEIFDTQKRIFLQHAEVAEKFNLPLVIHVREAHEEMIALLKILLLSGGVGGGLQQETVGSVRGPLPASPDRGGDLRGVIHCFTGNWEQAQEYLNMGFYLGFTGVVTFPAKKTDPKPQEELLEVVKNIPLDRILVETDAPYLAPQAYRGERSEPWMTEEVVKCIAAQRGLSVDEFRKKTVENTRQLFTRIP